MSAARRLPVIEGPARRPKVRALTLGPRELRAQARGLGPTPEPHPADAPPRPRTRADCQGHEPGCPWVSCFYHLYLDVNPRTGSIKVNFPALEPDELPVPCVLWVAEKFPDGVSFETAGRLMNLTRERISQVMDEINARLQGTPEFAALARAMEEP